MNLQTAVAASSWIWMHSERLILPSWRRALKLDENTRTSKGETKNYLCNVVIGLGERDALGRF